MHNSKKWAARLLCILTIVLSGLLGGCTAPASQPDPQGETIWYGPLKEATFLTNDLCFFLSENTHLLYCADVNTGVAVPLCNKVMCEHDGESCEASIIGNQFTPLFFWNDGLYYTELDGYGTHLYRRNPDGTGLSRVATLCEIEMEENDVDIGVTTSILADGKFYFHAEITTVMPENDGLISKKLKDQICCVDLGSGKQTVIAEYLGDDNRIEFLAAGGSCVVYSLQKWMTRNDLGDDYEDALKTAAVKLIRVNEKTKEQTVIFEKKGADFSVVKFFNGCILYVPYDYDTDDYYTAFDLNTGKETQSLQMATSGINEEYSIKNVWDSEGKKSIHVMDNKTETLLPLEIAANYAFVNAVSGRGLVLQIAERYCYDDAEAPHETTLYYIPFSALHDGIQAADAVNIYSYRHH